MATNFLLPRLGTLQTAVINFSASGDSTVIAAISGKAILVHRFVLVAGGATNLTIKRGSTALSGAMPLVSGGSFSVDISGEPWYVTGVNEAFVMNSSSAVSIGGTIYYDVFPPL